MKRWIITVLGKDRPGIVAGVTKTLYQLACNLEDSAMTRLEGEFAIMLIFSGPARLTPERVERAFAALARRMRLTVHLKPLSKQETRTPHARGRTYRISVYGADRPGIVFRIAEVLARARANITDVHTHRSTGVGPSLYLTLLEVELPPRSSPASLEQTLRRAAARLGVEVSLRAVETEVL